MPGMRPILTIPAPAGGLNEDEVASFFCNPRNKPPHSGSRSEPRSLGLPRPHPVFRPASVPECP